MISLLTFNGSLAVVAMVAIFGAIALVNMPILWFLRSRAGTGGLYDSPLGSAASILFPWVGWVLIFGIIWFVFGGIQVNP